MRGYLLSSLDYNGVGMTSQRTRERLIQRLQDQGITDKKVLNVMRVIPRHLFLDEALSHRSYEDIALPIGFGQTLSRPYAVATILAKLVEKIYSVERIKSLQDKARTRLNKLDIKNVRLIHGDGGHGLEEFAPYDAILRAAAPNETPEKLLMQLAPNGILIIPVGPRDEQELKVIIRNGKSSNFTERVVEKVRFVPLMKGLTS